MKKQDKIDVHEVTTNTSVAHLRRIRARFLRGPIPMVDIALASDLGGHALMVLLLLHHRTVLTKSRSVTLPSGLLRECGIGRDTKARALRALEAAELIVVERNRGKSARIRLLEHPGIRLPERLDNQPNPVPG